MLQSSHERSGQGRPGGAAAPDPMWDRLKGLVQLAAGTTFQDFQQQLAQRVGLPAAQLQVVIACSRANEFDQLQKIPIHEGTVSVPLLSGCVRAHMWRHAATWRTER